MRKPQVPVVLYTHPFELALGAVLVVNGARGFTGGLSPSMTALPAVPLFLYLLVSTLGGIGVVTGLFLNDRAGKNYDRLANGLALERASLFLVAAAYFALGVMVVGVNHSRGTPTAILIVIISGACILRTVAIRRSVKAVTAALRRRRTQGGAS